MLSEVGGRVRMELVGLRGDERRAREIEQRLASLPGVDSANASAVTGNVLVEFDARVTDVPHLRATLEPPPRASGRLQPKPASIRPPSPQLTLAFS